MAAASVGQYPSRPCFGRKTLRRCQNNTATTDMVFIDVDGDDVDDVIVIDSPELFSKKPRGSSVNKNKRRHQRVIICIDEEESADNNHSDTGVKNRCNFSSGASSSKGPSTAANNHDMFSNNVSDDCEFVRENIASPVKISKCKRTYSGKAPSINRYDLGPEPENGVSNDEFLDCELVEEDSSGSVRGQWDKAFSKRKYGTRNGKTVVGCGKASKASHNANFRAPKIAAEQPNEPPDFSSSEKAEESQQVWQLLNHVNGVVPLNKKNDDLCGFGESCTISNREKLKETEEYKKAIDEEWASRRQVLQIQAAEVKQLRLLRKRENAELMRLLDMEKRQKQRVEEIRETIKNDEKQMHIKDQIRAEVRNELSKVEIACHDMASLLRSLGIQVGSELRPNADEVRAACKRALFTFHPDRASKSDTRQQVEGEEKFKLICRMKEKFSVA